MFSPCIFSNRKYASYRNSKILNITRHFYIHIPFCRQKCPYCKFALTPIFDEYKKKRYIEYLKKEIREYFLLSSCKDPFQNHLGKKEDMDAFHSGKNKLNSFGSSSLCEFCISVDKIFVKIATFLNFAILENESNTDIKMKHGRLRKLLLLLVSKVKKYANNFGTFSHKSTSETDLSSSTDTGLCRDDKKYIKTIYFGGGTPSILSIEEIKEILECFPFYGKTETEITLEANPEDINGEYITGLLSLGINRISLGIQTLNEKGLTEIHRSNRESIFNAFESIGSIPQISLNVDFILGLPYVQPGETLDGIKKLHSGFPFITHTSIYMLEDDIYPKHWKENSITENELQSEFLEIINYFESIGWNHYELSNWAKLGYESVHNRAYWNHSNSRGFGLAAASYEHNQRWNNVESFNSYYTGKIENKETLTKEQIEIENMMFALRTNGWNIDSQKIASQSKIQKLISEGLLEIRNNTIKPTKTGIFVIDHIMSELLS